MSDRRSPGIVHVVHSLEGGGTERGLVSLLCGLDSSYGRHVVVTLRGAGPLAARLPDHVSCRPIGATGRSRTTCLKLARIAREWKASVIHARNTGCWYDATVAGLLMPGARLVLGFHGLETGPTFSRRQRQLARLGLYAGARFVSVSEAGKRQLIAQAAIPPERVDVLINGIDLCRFSRRNSGVRRDTRRRFDFGDSAFVVGIVGSLTPVKQHAVLLSAFGRAVARAGTMRLLIVGDGPLRTTLEDQTRAEGVEDRVRFAGWCEDVPAMLAGMDAYVCSSESEGMNNALLEAMAARVPIIATDVGDNAAVLRNEIEGLIVEPGSVTAMARSLELLAESPSLRDRLGHAARSRVREYGIDRMVSAYDRYYRGLMGVGLGQCGDAMGRSGTEERRAPERSGSEVVPGRRRPVGGQPMCLDGVTSLTAAKEPERNTPGCRCEEASGVGETT